MEVPRQIYRIEGLSRAREAGSKGLDAAKTGERLTSGDLLVLACSKVAWGA